MKASLLLFRKKPTVDYNIALKIGMDMLDMKKPKPMTTSSFEIHEIIFHLDFKLSEFGKLILMSWRILARWKWYMSEISEYLQEFGSLYYRVLQPDLTIN